MKMNIQGIGLDEERHRVTGFLLHNHKILVITNSLFFQANWTVSPADKALCIMKGKDTEV